MPGLLRGIVRTAAISGTATAVSNRVSRRQAERWAQHDAQPEYGYAEPPSSPAPPAPDLIGQLKELAALREQGILTDAEFAEQKSRLLAA